MKKEASDNPINNEEAKSLLTGEESITKPQPVSDDNLPFQTIHDTQKSKSIFENILGGLNVLFTGLMVLVTVLLVHWASKQWEVMNGQWEAMKTSIEVAKETNIETKSLSEETIKYAKKQTEASELLAEAARSSADVTMRTAKLYLALDLQQKRPFLAPVIHARKPKSGEQYYWSWGAKNSGAVIARLLYADHRAELPNKKIWRGPRRSRDEIIYPGETLELLGEIGDHSGLAVICIVYEEVSESGKNRRWTGFAQYIFTEQFARLSRNGFDPEMQLVHRTEHPTPPGVATCDAVDWWRKLSTVSTGESDSNTAKPQKKSETSP